MSRRAIHALLFAAGLALTSCSNGNAPKSGNSASPSGQPSAPTVDASKVRFRGLDIVDAQTAFVFGETQDTAAQNVVVKTADGGATWSVVLRIPAKDVQGTAVSDLQAIDFVDGQNGVVMDEDGATYATSDGGATWTGAFGGQMTRRFPAKEPEEETIPEFSGVVATSAREGWALGVQQIDPPAGDKAAPTVTAPVVFHTSDGGATWKSAKVEAGEVSVPAHRIAFGSPQVGWIVGGDAEVADEGNLDVVFRTKDGGSSWQKVPVKTGLVLTDVAFVDANRGFVVGSTDDEGAETSIFETKDGGSTWQAVAKAPAALYAIRFADDQKGWAVGAEGAIMSTSDGGSTWSEAKIGDLANGGVSVARPKMVGASDEEQSAFFYGIALTEPNRGWIATDEGIFEYRRK
jgi:photosystem II stability/assembly factor-like uncharacterized protein